MTATNHALTGAFIGLTIGNPLLALVIAFLSHFVLDALPHFGSRLPAETYVRSAFFKRLLATDITLCLILVGILSLVHPEHWLLAAVCAFVATLPDAVMFKGFLRAQRGRPFTVQPNWFERFSAAIQWYEQPPGAIVECLWAAGMISLLVSRV